LSEVADKDDKTTGLRSKTSDDVQLAASQPKADSNTREGDTTKASPKSAREAVLASAAPSADRVVMVSRDVNGEPAQSDNFHVMVPEDASDELVDAHWNRAGEALGAKHVTDADHAALDNWDTSFSAEELKKREDTEAKELARHNFRQS
jgi:hypothetical protein